MESCTGLSCLIFVSAHFFPNITSMKKRKRGYIPDPLGERDKIMHLHVSFFQGLLKLVKKQLTSHEQILRYIFIHLYSNYPQLLFEMI